VATVSDARDLLAALVEAAEDYHNEHPCEPHHEWPCPRVGQSDGATGRARAFLAQPATPVGALEVDGIVAELMGVEAHLDEARERLIKANATLARLAAASEPAAGEP
jgi:hypothetical protein